MSANTVATTASRAHSARYLEKREFVLTRAAAVFNRQGVNGATLADVAMAVGLNLTSLRHYFVKKEDLVVAAFMRSIERHRALVEEARGQPTREDSVRALAHAYFAFRKRVRLGEEPEVMQFGDVRSLPEPLSSEVWPHYNNMFRALREIICLPQELREQRQRMNARSHTLLSQFLYSVFWLPDYAPEDFDRVEARFVDIILNGFTAAGAAFNPRLARLPQEAEPDRMSRDSFLRAATQLINEQGYRGASVEAIAARLNVTKGSFYHHLDGKDDLVVACFERSNRLLQQAQRTAIEREQLGLDQAASAVSALVHRQHTPAGPLLRSSALTSVDPETRGGMLIAIEHIGNRFGDMLADGIIDGSVRPCDPRIGAVMLTALVNSAAELTLWTHETSPERAVELYVQPIFRGLFA